MMNAIEQYYNWNLFRLYTTVFLYNWKCYLAFWFCSVGTFTLEEFWKNNTNWNLKLIKKGNLV